MSFRHVRRLAAVMVALALVGGAAAHAAERASISGPFIHENLAVYFMRGATARGTVPLTLEEALARQKVRIHETGDVNRLQIETLGDEEVFVQSGDIVKGGKQDRVLTVSLLLPARSGRVTIDSFCVEQGRWTARGNEDVAAFSSARTALPSREAKLAIKAPPPVGSHVAPQADVSVRQSQVWTNVERIQEKLSTNLGGRVAAPQSQTSLQLALENTKLQARKRGYAEALLAQGQAADDIVGFAFAVNGKLSGADVYPGNALFRKMWPKLLTAAATEAIGEGPVAGAVAPSAEDVVAFLTAAEQGKASRKLIDGRVATETRDAPGALYVEAQRKDGVWFHRSYVAK